MTFIRGGSDGKSRNGEAEAVANAVCREAVAMDESSNTTTKVSPLSSATIQPRKRNARRCVAN